jgi:hypothetical protein
MLVLICYKIHQENEGGKENKKSFKIAFAKDSSRRHGRQAIFSLLPGEIFIILTYYVPTTSSTKSQTRRR